MDNNCNMKWLEWAKELQFLAQVGLTYTKDDFDKERYERIRAIAAEMMSLQSGLPLERVQDLFCNETGFQTPKMDTRAAIFSGNKILLVKEKNGKWSMPGGWVDVMQTIKSNTVKEVREEAGLDVEAVRIIAMQDRNKHNQPPYAYNVCKVFVLCKVLGGNFQPNIETVDSRYFGLDELPGKVWKKEDELKQLKSELAALDRKIQLELAPPTPEVAEKENEGQQLKPEAEDVRNRQAQYPENAPPQIRSPADSIVANHVIIGRPGLYAKEETRSKGLKI